MAQFGIELELAVLLFILLVGANVFAPFEVETPAWRKMLKWSLVIGLTLGLTGPLGHWALAVPIGLGSLGLTFHMFWCKKHGIHPLRATPRLKYYRLRDWQWHE
jgi:hypothetical protein